MGALLFWGMAMTSCQGFIDSVVGVEDNPASGTEVAAKNISEPSDFEAYIDMSTYAGDSFYQYAVGKWLDENPLKNEEYSNGTMAEQAELSYEFVKNLAGSNYGVMGATTIGHEITHNFDSEGRKYNKVGKLENWWTAADIKTFEEFEKLMIDNFNGLTYYGNHQCNGKNTLAENIADLGGLNNAYDAFIKKQTDKGISGAELDRQGREFYRGFAVGWMENPTAIKLSKIMRRTSMRPTFCA